MAGTAKADGGHQAIARDDATPQRPPDRTQENTAPLSHDTTSSGKRPSSGYGEEGQVSQQSDGPAPTPEANRELREKLAMACRIRAAEGHNDIVYGHMSPEPPHRSASG
jgi:hypothetical protein